MKKNPDNSADNFTIKDLPLQERPRERLIKYGSGYLSNSEILAIILRSGSKGETVIALAQRLLKTFGSLNELMEASYQELIAVKGIGAAKACNLIACFEVAKRSNLELKGNELKRLSRSAINSSEDCILTLREWIQDYTVEQYFVLLMDVRNRVIGVEKVSLGILTASLVHPRETFYNAIKKKAAKIIIAHNHPSGDVSPSDEDIKITKRIAESGVLLGITVLDHLIVTKTSYFSFKDQGLI